MDLEEEVESEIERQINAYRDKIERLETERAIAQGQTIAPDFPTFENILAPILAEKLPSPSHSQTDRNEVPRTSRDAISGATDLGESLNVDEEYKPLHDFFVFVASQRLHKNEFESESLASDWVKCWNILGYTYNSMLSLVIDFLQKKANGLVPFDLLPKKLWGELNLNRQRLPQKVSASFLVDRTIEHFKILMKSDPARFRVVDPPLVDLEPDDEPGFKVEVLEQPPDFEIDEVTSTTNCFVEPSHRAAESSQQPKQSEEFICVNKEMYDFMWQKMGSIAGSLQTTNLTTESVMNVIVESGLNAASIVALYGCDRYYIEASMVHQDIEHRRSSRIQDLLNAFLRPVSPGLPQVCSLKSLVAFLMEYCLESKFIDSFLTPDAFEAYNIALQGLPQTTEIKSEHPPALSASTSPQQTTSSHYKPRSLPTQYKKPPGHESDSFDDSESLPDVDDGPMPDERHRQHNFSQPPRVINARDFKFSHGDDSLVHEKSDHPMCRLGPLPTEDFDRCLKIFCHLESLGEGILGSDLLQIGAYSENGEKFFAPILPPKTSRSMLEKLGYKTRSQSGRKLSSDSKITYQHKVDRSIPCESVKEGIRALLTFFEKSMDEESDGILLVFLHPENLMDLTRELWILKNHRFLEKFSVVKGVVFVEEIVRNYFIHNHDGVGYQRLDMNDVCTIIFRNDIGDATEADQKAKMLFTISRQMSQSDVLKGKLLARRLSSSRWQFFDSFFRQLKNYRELQQFVSKKLQGESDSIQLCGLFSMFPNLLYRDFMSKYNEKELSVAAKFVELLVSSGLLRDKLIGLFESRNTNHLFSEVKSILLRQLSEQPYAVVTQIETCIIATIDWLKDTRKTHHLAISRDDSMDFELSPSPPPPKRSSQSNSGALLRLAPEFVPLRDEMARALDKTLLNMGISYELATDMARVWPEVGFSLKTLIEKINNVRNEEEERAVAAELRFIVKKKEPTYPARWKGQSVDFFIDSTMRFLTERRESFVETRSDHVEKQKDLFELVDIISEDEISGDEDLNPRPSTVNSEILDQKQLGFGNVKRIVPQVDLQKFKAAVDCLPDVMELLDRFCEYAKGSSDMWSGVNNKVIILDLVKLMDRNGLTIEHLYKRWIESTDRTGLEKHLTEQIFGEHFGSKSSAKGCYKGTNDFDFYRELFVKLFDIFAQRRVKTTQTKRGKKRYSQEQDYEVMPSKRRRATATSSASSISEESLPQHGSDDSDSLEQSLSSKYKSYLRCRSAACPPSYQALHEAIFYDEMIRKEPENRAKLPDIANDFIDHLLYLKLGHDDILQNIRQYLSSAEEFPEELVSGYLKTSLHKEDDSKFLKTKGKMYSSVVEAVTRYFRQEICCSKISAETLKGVNFTATGNEELDSLGLYLTSCFEEKTRKMIAEEEVKGLTTANLEIQEIKHWAALITQQIANSGFSISNAIKLHSKGKLSEYLAEMTSHNNFSLPAKLLVEICFNWIDAMVKCRSPYHLPFNIKLLGPKIISLIKSGKVVTPVLARRVTFQTSQVTSQHLDEIDPTMIAVVKEPNCQTGKESSEPYVAVPGNIITLEDVTVHPGQRMEITVALCDVPRIRTHTQLKLLASANLTEMNATVTETASLLRNYQLDVTLCNNHPCDDLILPRGTIIASAIVQDTVTGVMLPRSAPLYNLLLLRHYCMLNDGDMSGVTLNDDKVRLGRGFEIVLEKNSEILFPKSSIVDKSYTVDMVVSFLTHYKHETESAFENYIQKLTLDGITDFIDEKDSGNLFQYLHGHCKWLPKSKNPLICNFQQEKSATTVSFENFPRCLEEQHRIGIDLLSRVVHCQIQQLRISEVEAKKRLETILGMLKQGKYDCLTLQRLVVRAGKSRFFFEKLLWEKCIASAPAAEKRSDPENLRKSFVLLLRLLRNKALKSQEKSARVIERQNIRILKMRMLNFSVPSNKNCDENFDFKKVSSDILKAFEDVDRNENNVKLNNNDWFFACLNGASTQELWNSEKVRTKVRKQFLPIINYFDKILFEMFEKSNKLTSLQMVDSWISARCSPEILEKIYFDFGPKCVHIYKTLLEGSDDKHSQDACIDLLAQVTFEYWSSLTKTSKTRDQNIYKGQSIFKQILNIQAQDIDQASYNRLQVFYHDLCSSHRDAEISSLNVNVWIWLGFEFESLEKIFTSAATDKVCLEQVIFKLTNLFRKVQHLLDASLDSVRLIETTLMFFRARALVEAKKIDSSGFASDSWQDWFSKKNSPNDLTVKDVEKVDRELSPENWNPLRLLDIYRQIVSTTSGVSSDVIRTSLCHALAPSNLSSHDSMKKVFDHFLVMEDVEDGELLSDSEEETERLQQQGSMKKVIEKNPEENRIFGFEEVKFHPTADDQSKAKHQFAMLTQHLVYDKPANFSKSDQIRKLISQQLFRVTFSTGLHCQKNWRQVASLASDDLSESLSSCNLDDVIDDLRSHIFGEPSEANKILPEFYHDLLDLLLDKSQSFSPSTPFHELAKDLLFILQDVARQTGPHEDCLIDDFDAVMDDLDNGSNANLDSVDQEMSDDFDEKNAGQNSRPVTTRQLSSNVDVSPGDFESLDSPIDTFVLDDTPVVGDYESPDSPPDFQDNLELEGVPRLGSPPGNTNEVLIIQDSENTPNNPIKTLNHGQLVLEDIPLGERYESPDSPPENQDYVEMDDTPTLGYQVSAGIGSPNGFISPDSPVQFSKDSNLVKGIPRLVEDYESQDSSFETQGDMELDVNPHLVENFESPDSPNEKQGDSESDTFLVIDSSSPDRDKRHSDREVESPEYPRDFQEKTEQETVSLNDVTPVVHNFVIPRSDDTQVDQNLPLINDSYESLDSPIENQDHVEFGHVAIISEVQVCHQTFENSGAQMESQVKIKVELDDIPVDCNPGEIQNTEMCPVSPPDQGSHEPRQVENNTYLNFESPVSPTAEFSPSIETGESSHHCEEQVHKAVVQNIVEQTGSPFHQTSPFTDTQPKTGSQESQSRLQLPAFNSNQDLDPSPMLSDHPLAQEGITDILPSRVTADLHANESPASPEAFLDPE